MMVVAFVAACQAGLALLRQNIFQHLPWAIVLTLVMGLVYGSSVHFIAWALKPINMMQPQPLNGFHLVGMMILIMPWLMTLFVRRIDQAGRLSNLMSKYYVSALNASQPHPATVTAHHNQYQYL